jgi:two-component system, OmpR family, sensor histidine kinase KdpD
VSKVSDDRSTAASEEGGFSPARGIWQRVREGLIALGVVGVCTTLGALLGPYITESDQVMLFFLGVVLVASRGLYFASALTALLGVATFNFFFVSPVYTFVVDETRYWLTFLVMTTLGLLVSRLVWRARQQAAQREVLVAENYRAELSLQTERLRNSLLSSISHDLRTPVASIVGSAELLLVEGIDLPASRRRQLMASVHSEARRLQDLLINLLAMTRIEGGGLRLNRDWHLAEEIIGAALHRAEGLLDGREVIVRVEGPMVYVDETSVTTALTNLVENAAKYSESGTRIMVGSRVDDAGWWTLEVWDEGDGLDGVEVDALFEKFHRGENTGDVVGSGLGLSIVKAVVDAHTGEVFAQSRTDRRGSVFGFRIDQGDAPALPVLDDDSPSLEVGGMR